MFWWLFSCCLVALLVGSYAADNEIRIGVLLGYNVPRSQQSPEELAFFLAIDKINRDNLLNGRLLRGYVEKVNPEDDYDHINKANKLISRGIVVLIGPMTSNAISVTGPLTSFAHIPQILPLTSWDTSDLNSQEYGYLLRMSPSEKLKARALVDIIIHYKWKKVAVLGLRGEEYSQGKNAFKIIAAQHEIEVTMDRLFPPSPTPGKGIFPHMELMSLAKAELRVVVVFAPAWAVGKLLKIADKFFKNPRLTEWAWVFSDLGNSDRDLLGPVRVTPPIMRGLIGLRPSFGKGRSFKNLQKNFQEKMETLNRTAQLTTSAGYVFDSVLMAAKGIQGSLQQKIPLSSMGPSVGICSSDNQARNSGKELYYNIRKASIEGAMNNLSFEETGEPRCASFDVINLRASGSVKVAEWNTENFTTYNNTKVIWMSGSTKVPFDIPNYLKNKTVKVVTVLAPPFVMRKSGGNNDTDQEFEGLSVDILNYMSKELGFNYKIFLAPDGKFGTRDRGSNEWNGVMKEIIDKRATLSIAPLTINSDGQNAVDFTHPYMTFGIAFVMRVNEVRENYFRFLMPYHRDLWMAICGMVITMGVVLWKFSILSPFGFYGRYAQHPNKLKVEREIKATKKTFSFVNAVWSSWLCYLRQGGQHPASFSGKMAVSVFWFAIMIFNATYTANLAAHLTVSRMQTPIESVEDLALQTKIKYGTLMDSQLQKFFLDTDVPRFLVMGQFMEQQKTWMPDYNTAIDRVMNDNFAFIADRPILEYITRQKKYCGKLKVIGGFGNTYGYGFALPLASPVTNLFNMEIFRLQRDLIIDRLKHKWSGKETCQVFDENVKNDNGKRGSTLIQRVRLQDMLGVFIFMGIGIALGFIFMILEWFSACITDVASKQGPNSYIDALAIRLRRVFSGMYPPDYHDDADDEQTTTQVTPIQIPKIAAQWKVRSNDMKQLRPPVDDRKDSVHEINSFEVSV